MFPFRKGGTGSPADWPSASMRINASDKNMQYYFNPFDTKGKLTSQNSQFAERFLL